MTKRDERRRERARQRFWEVVRQGIRVMRNPGKYVRREDERARRLAVELRRRVDEIADRLINGGE